MNHLNTLINEKEIFIKYFQAKYSFFNNSNIFLRDLQYSIQRYFETKKHYLSYSQAEKLAFEFASDLENKGELLRLTANSWRVNFSTESSLIQENVIELQQVKEN